jgi:hypothetical protein
VDAGELIPLYMITVLIETYLSSWRIAMPNLFPGCDKLKRT